MRAEPHHRTCSGRSCRLLWLACSTFTLFKNRTTSVGRYWMRLWDTSISTTSGAVFRESVNGNSWCVGEWVGATPDKRQGSVHETSPLPPPPPLGPFLTVPRNTSTSPLPPRHRTVRTIIRLCAMLRVVSMVNRYMCVVRAVS
jgi:hypothetical protein